MTPLTNRDKKLLVFLAVIVILFVFGKFVIAPQLNRTLDLQTSSALAELDRQEMEMKIATLAVAQKDNQDLKELLKTAADDYYPMLSSQEVDREVTGLFLEYGLEIEDLVISMPSEPSDLEPYVSSQMAQSEAEAANAARSSAAGAPANVTQNTAAGNDLTADTEAGAAGAQTGAARQADWQQDQIYAAEVLVRCTGSERRIAEVLDYLTNENAAVAVTRYSYEQPKQEETERGAAERQTLTVGFRLFMCDKEALQAVS